LISDMGGLYQVYGVDSNNIPPRVWDIYFCRLGRPSIKLPESSIKQSHL
jgi:hypothetical protein